jgi:hypothetical protein
LSSLHDHEHNGGIFEGVLKITTKQDGFNRGRTYYFMVRKNSFRSTRKKLHQTDEKEKDYDKDAGKKKHLQKVGTKLHELADNRKAAYNREHRFQLLQEALQGIWNSVPFNICVLILIVSNFIFTVLQLENKDPSQQAFFENVDLAYTIIFSIGNAFSSQSASRCFLHSERDCAAGASLLCLTCVVDQSLASTSSLTHSGLS